MTTLAQPAAAATHPLAGKHLTFLLGNESYGIAVLKIREIIRLQPITPVPQMPPHIKGVLNLRGKIIAVVDLRIKFGLQNISDTEHNCIIVVRLELPNRVNVHLGLIVDGVEEVANIGAAEIEPPPDFGATMDTAFILGLAKVKGSVKTLLDIDGLLADDVMGGLD